MLIQASCDVSKFALGTSYESEKTLTEGMSIVSSKSDIYDIEKILKRDSCGVLEIRRIIVYDTERAVVDENGNWSAPVKMEIDENITTNTVSNENREESHSEATEQNDSTFTTSKSERTEVELTKTKAKTSSTNLRLIAALVLAIGTIVLIFWRRIKKRLL